MKLSNAVLTCFCPYMYIFCTYMCKNMFCPYLCKNILTCVEIFWGKNLSRKNFNEGKLHFAPLFISISCIIGISSPSLRSVLHHWHQFRRFFVSRGREEACCIKSDYLKITQFLFRSYSPFPPLVIVSDIAFQFNFCKSLHISLISQFR